MKKLNNDGLPFLVCIVQVESLVHTENETDENNGKKVISLP